MSSKSKSNEIQITRVYDAPVETVWEAWCDPVQAAKWWGPRGFTITTHSKDLRAGGHWNYTMHGPDGTDYPNTTKYLEVEKNSKLVYDHGGSDDRPAQFRVTVLFADIGGKTKMDMTMALPSPEEAAQTKLFIKKAGGDGTWDRLAEFLEKELRGKENFVINRSFDASIEVMFDLWTNPKHFSQWLPPTGFKMEFINADIKENGSTFYSMFNETGVKMYGRIKYLKIERPKFISYLQQFCDENENISRHPFAPTWPETMFTQIRLSEEGPERTRVSVAWEPYGPTSKEEMDMFVQSRSGMTQGWTGSFDKLEQYLEERQR